MKLDAIYSDYDGTLCPLESRREDAFLSQGLRRLLVKVSKRIKLGIVTTKDLSYMKERVPFAQGISATCGLEMHVESRIVLNELPHESSGKIERAFHETVPKLLHVPENMVFEKKETEQGELIAFCIDWRESDNWDRARARAKPWLSRYRKMGLYVVESDATPFANVFPFPVDKGSALHKLRTEMGVTGPIIYLGDSEVDNPAFQLADISIGIKHQPTTSRLQCKYLLESTELESFLSMLIDSDFDFQETMLEKNSTSSSSAF